MTSLKKEKIPGSSHPHDPEQGGSLGYAKTVSNQKELEKDRDPDKDWRLYGLGMRLCTLCKDWESDYVDWE